jgi:hypothetical protein
MEFSSMSENTVHANPTTITHGLLIPGKETFKSCSHVTSQKNRLKPHKVEDDSGDLRAMRIKKVSGKKN